MLADHGVTMAGDFAQGAFGSLSSAAAGRLQDAYAKFRPGARDPYASQYGLGSPGLIGTPVGAAPQRGDLSALEQHLADQGYTPAQVRALAERQMFERLGMGGADPALVSGPPSTAGI